MKKLLLVLLALPLLFSCGGSLDKERSSEMSDEIPVDGGNQTAEDYFNKAKDYVENEQYQLAIDNLTAALKINPDYAEAYYNRGLTYYNLKNYTAAIADYTSALKINPDKADAYNNRGYAYEKLENYTAAIADYTSAIRIDPDYAYAYNNRGTAKKNAGLSYCSDFKKSCELGHQLACDNYNTYCK